MQMIEDKKLGLKVAENPKEALWEQVKQQAEITIKQAENSIEVNTELLKLAKKKLKK